MNIFTPYETTTESARALDDRRFIKSILEDAQMLCTAFIKDDPVKQTKLIESSEFIEMWNHTVTPFLPMLYKPTHENHPCTVWVRKHPNNWLWLHRHFLACSAEYTYRFNKTHKSYLTLEPFFDLVAQMLLTQEYSAINHTPIIYVGKELPEEYNNKSVFDKYKKLLHIKWNQDKTFSKWTSVPPPDFLFVA